MTAATTNIITHDLCPIGSVKDFDPDHDDWPVFIELLGHYFTANAITSAPRRRSILLSLIGIRTYRSLCATIYPDKPGDRSYDQLCSLLATHFAPVVRFRERAHFYGAHKLKTESVTQYLERVRRLAAKCAFNDDDDALLDRFVIGMQLNAMEIFERLCLEDAMTTLSLDRAVALARQVEQQQQQQSECEFKCRFDVVKLKRQQRKLHEDEGGELRTGRSDCGAKWKSECSLIGRMNNLSNDLVAPPPSAKGSSLKVCNLCVMTTRVRKTTTNSAIAAELKAKSCDRLNHAYSINKEKIDSLKLNYVS